MTVVYVERPVVASRVVGAPVDPRSVWLESLDGSRLIRFDNSPFTLLPGVQGLTGAPVDVVVSQSPGVEGGSVDEVQTTTRPVTLPIEVAGSWVQRAAAMALLREVALPGLSPTGVGSFKIVGSSPAGPRELTVVYLSGLEGDEGSIPGVDRFPLALLAVDPYARDRDIRPVEFSVAPSERVMVSDDPATAGERGLSSSVVIGENMPVNVNSEVPVWVRMDVTGPATSLEVESDTGLHINMPTGVPAGSTFTAIFDPRKRSYRLDDDLAGGLIARGARVAPLRPGLNTMSVAAPGATDETRVTLSWRGGFRSLW